MTITLADDMTGITVMPVGNHGELHLWSATLGDGTRRGFAPSHDEALERGRRAKRYLLAVESHDPEALEAQAQAASDSGRVELVSAWGGRIEVNAADVEQALANGCRLLGDEEEPQHAASVSPPERARRRSAQRATPEDDGDEM